MDDRSIVTTRVETNHFMNDPQNDEGLWAKALLLFPWHRVPGCKVAGCREKFTLQPE